MINSIILSNAFSLNMLPKKFMQHVRIVEITDWQAAALLSRADKVVNAIGHGDTDALVRGLLTKAHYPSKFSIAAGDRISIKMTETDTLVVAQYSGPRLPEGTTSLPEGAKIEFMLVQILPHGSVNLLHAAELAWKDKIVSKDGNETDVGGWPIIGHYELATTGVVVGSWGPTSWESGIDFPDGPSILGH